MKNSENQRIQKDGWNYGKRTTTRKTSVNLDEDVGMYLERKRIETGLFIGRIINDSLRHHFGLVVR